MNLNDNLKLMSIAMVSNATAETMTLPITATRVVYQTNSLSILKTIKEINNRKGFFNGFVPSVFSKAISIGMKYTIYKKIRSYRNTQEDDILNNLVNGFLCGIIGTTITNPLMVWRIQLQRGSSMKIKYAYRGLGYSILRCLPLYTLLFPFYDFYQKKFEIPMVAAACTSITIFPIVQPFDYLRTRKAAGYSTKFNLNIKKYYRGGSLAIMRNMPHLMISMTIIDFLNKRINV